MTHANRIISIAKAPGVLKLFGEHAVVYGRKCVAFALGRYATVKISRYKEGLISIFLKDKGQRFEIDRNLALAVQNLYDSNPDSVSFAFSDLSRQYNNSLPAGSHGLVLSRRIFGETCAYGLIVSQFMKKNEDVFGVSAEISSDIPEKKGLASSASCFVAFAVALAGTCQKKLPDRGIIEIARHGEIIAHKNRNAGRIDTAASYFGGLVSYRAGKITKYDLSRVEGLKSTDLIVIDTGPKKSTAETVRHVRMLYEKNRRAVESIFDRIESCAKTGLQALLHSRMEQFGVEMYRNQELLARLGISTKNLDLAVGICKANNAYGAKLSGGGGGGIAISFVGKKNSKNLVKAIEKNRFKVFKSVVSKNGARDFFEARRRAAA
ncbi:mevalonate kinase [Candidatus Marsarchaeota archaeon]|nr:mevalonate kinase [Candidatus Marsarchaeota archaeon]